MILLPKTLTYVSYLWNCFSKNLLISLKVTLVSYGPSLKTPSILGFRADDLCNAYGPHCSFPVGWELGDNPERMELCCRNQGVTKQLQEQCVSLPSNVKEKWNFLRGAREADKIIFGTARSFPTVPASSVLISAPSPCWTPQALSLQLMDW